jgi:DNA polymerase-1
LVSDRILLIDGDVLLYEVVHQTTFPVEIDDGMWQQFGDAKSALSRFWGRVRQLQGLAEACESVVLLSGEGKNFRLDVDPKYKCRRDHDKKRPVHFKAVRQGIIAQAHANHVEVQVEENLEADDLLGIWATTKDGREPVICTIDKDLNQIPGWHLNPRTQDMYFINDEAADQFFYKQALSGDSVDDIPGCPTIGDIRAGRIIDGVEGGRYWDAVLKTYETKGCTEEDAVRNARLVRILRFGDYDFIGKKVRLWVPSSS